MRWFALFHESNALWSQSAAYPQNATDAYTECNVKLDVSAVESRLFFCPADAADGAGHRPQTTSPEAELADR